MPVLSQHRDLVADLFREMLAEPAETRGLREASTAAARDAWRSASDPAAAAPLLQAMGFRNGSESAGVLNIPTIGFGPALETDAHVRDESVAVADLRAAFRGFVGILSEVQQLS